MFHREERIKEGREGERKREMDLHLLFYLQNSYRDQGWVMVKAGALSPRWVFHMGGRVPRTWTMFPFFPRSLSGCQIECGAAKTRTTADVRLCLDTGER